MICCGKERDGRFCSSCGKQLMDDAAMELLRHLRSTIKAMEKASDLARRRSSGPDADWWSKQNANKDRAIAKWRRWEAALVALIDPVPVDPAPDSR